MDDVYVQNTHYAPITCNARDKQKGITLTKKFMPYITEKWSGNILSSGYERLSGEEYKSLCETSRTFQHYKDDLKLLVVHDKLPEALKTPREALGEMKKAVKVSQEEIAALKAENERLKTEIEGLKGSQVQDEHKKKNS